MASPIGRGIAAPSGPRPGNSALTLAPIASAAAAAFSAAAIAVGLAGLYALPRLAHAFLREGRVYPLYGFHHSMQRMVETFSNSAFFNLLFGDSVFIESYLRFVGWRLGGGDFAGSNFGCEQGQDNPFLCTIGRGTMASDGLRLGNFTMSSHSFKLGECRVGARNFLGTDVYVPPGSRMGDNCLLATKVMAPIDGPLRENVGLLGSPCFEIPRAASRDLELLAKIGPAGASSAPRAKDSAQCRDGGGLAGLALVRSVLGALGHVSDGGDVRRDEFPGDGDCGGRRLRRRARRLHLRRTRLDRLRPPRSRTWRRCTIRRSGAWSGTGSCPTAPLSYLFSGTPMRNVVSRLLGAKIGRKVFDDGCLLSERTLVEIGDYANLNHASFIQSHSLEEGVFKSDFVRIGAGCSLGVGAFVHYGVVMHEETRLDADSFLMKGEITPPHSRWRGNPARLVSRRFAPPTISNPN